jgi:KDO2-lipid IV(A) lauroyltransferase
MKTVVFRFVFCLLRLLSLLPLRVLHSLGVAFSRTYFFCSPKAKKRLQQQLAQTPYAHLIDAIIDEQGKMIFESPFVHFRTCLPLTIIGLEHIKNQRPTLLLTPHFGGFEAILRPLTQTRTTTALYKPPNYELANVLHKDGRLRHGVLLAPTDQTGIKTILKALHCNQLVAMLPDQVPDNGAGTWETFFNRPAYTTTLPTRLYEKTHCDIVLACAIRQPKGKGFTVEIYRWSDLMKDTPINSAQVNVAMEKLIARVPEQYLWSYNRYKKP